MDGLNGNIVAAAATYVDECAAVTAIEKVVIDINEKADAPQVTITGQSGDYERVYLLPDFA